MLCKSYINYTKTPPESLIPLMMLLTSLVEWWEDKGLPHHNKRRTR